MRKRPDRAEWISYQMIPSDRPIRYFFSSPKTCTADWEESFSHFPRSVLPHEFQGPLIEVAYTEKLRKSLEVPQYLNQTFLSTPKTVFENRLVRDNVNDLDEDYNSDDAYKVQVRVKPRVLNDYEEQQEILE